jgi:hypothetical protein
MSNNSSKRLGLASAVGSSGVCYLKNFAHVYVTPTNAIYEIEKCLRITVKYSVFLGSSHTITSSSNPLSEASYTFVCV